MNRDDVTGVDAVHWHPCSGHSGFLVSRADASCTRPHGGPSCARGFFHVRPIVSTEVATMSERATFPPFRYTAAMAGEIETRWQDYWDENGTFNAPNPTGPLSRSRPPARRRAEAVRDGHVPVPVRRGPARRPPAGLHRHRQLHPVRPHDRVQRAAPDGLRRLRPAGRAVRGADRHPPAQDHRGERRALPGQLRRLGLAYDNRRSFATTDVDVLPLDPVDLPADLQLLVRPGAWAGRGRSPN